MDEAEEYKYLRVWMESRLNRNTDMEKGIERAKAAKQRVRWMQRMNGNYGDQARGSYMGKYGTASCELCIKGELERDQTTMEEAECHTRVSGQNGNSGK